MPNYKIHLLAGGLAFFAITYMFNLTVIEITAYASITLMYSLLPDIDVGNSKLGKWTRIFFVLLTVYFLIQGIISSILYIALAIVILLVLLALLLVKHRKYIHTLRAGILFSLPLLIWNWQAFLVGVGMYSLHLLLDRSLRF